MAGEPRRRLRRLRPAPSDHDPALGERGVGIELGFAFASLLVIPLMVLETRPDETLSSIGTSLYSVLWGVFVIERVVAFAVAGKRRTWLRRNLFSMVALGVAAPGAPVILQLLVAARALRIFQLRQVRRYIESEGVQKEVFSGRGLRTAAAAALVALFVSGWAFAEVEHAQHLTVWDGVWFSMVTAATVGYGDIVPHTLAGRLIAIFMMLVGIGLAGLFTGALAERFLHSPAAAGPAEEDVGARLDEISERLARLEQALGQRPDQTPEPGSTS
jgi:voltage-gated potassium channel